MDANNPSPSEGLSADLELALQGVECDEETSASVSMVVAASAASDFVPGNNSFYGSVEPMATPQQSNGPDSAAAASSTITSPGSAHAQPSAAAAQAAAAAAAAHHQQQQQQNKGYETFYAQNMYGMTGTDHSALSNYYLYNQSYQYNSNQGLGESGAAGAGAGGAANTGTWSNADAVAGQYLGYHSAVGMDYTGGSGFGLAPYNMWSAGAGPWAGPQDYGDITASWGRGNAAAAAGAHAGQASTQDYYGQAMKSGGGAAAGAPQMGYSGYAAASGPLQMDYDRQNALRALDQNFKHFGIGEGGGEQGASGVNQAAQGVKKDDFPTISSAGAAAGQAGCHGGSKQPQTWAKIASQPAKGSAATMQPLSSGVAAKKAVAKAPGRGTPGVLPKPSMHWAENTNSSYQQRAGNGFGGGQQKAAVQSAANPRPSPPAETGNPDTDRMLKKLAATINPAKFELNVEKAKFFVIKSYSEDDIHRSIKYGIWCSTDHGNKKLDCAYREMQAVGGFVYLFFSVNGSGHFCGLARMDSSVDYDSRAGVWCQDKWRGKFQVAWLYVKDVPNNQLRHIRLETNENKPVTNSRDATDVPLDKGKAVMKVIHSFKHQTSIFDDFTHYERREQEVGHDY